MEEIKGEERNRGGQKHCVGQAPSVGHSGKMKFEQRPEQTEGPSDMSG